MFHEATGLAQTMQYNTIVLFCHIFNILQKFYMVQQKRKIKWQGDLKETTGLILCRVSSLQFYSFLIKILSSCKNNININISIHRQFTNNILSSENMTDHRSYELNLSG